MWDHVGSRRPPHSQLQSRLNGYWATCETWMTLAVWLRGQRCECVGREIPKHHGPDFSADPTPLPSV